MSASERYRTPGAFRSALEDRLRQSAYRKESDWLVRRRKFMVFDRLLARLLVIAPDRWILKGAVALDFRLGAQARATMDLDLHRVGQEDAAIADLIAAQSLDLADFFSFTIERTEALNDLINGHAVRYRVEASLDGRLFERFTLDVGFDQDTNAPPDLLTGPDYFAFAGIDPIRIPTLPLETHVAEKLHAYTRFYGDARQSSRVKDLIDIVLIAKTSEFTATALKRAIDTTFHSRGAPEVPRVLQAPPVAWLVPYRALATDTGLDPDMRSGHAAAARLLEPLLDGSASGTARWKPEVSAWE